MKYDLPINSAAHALWCLEEASRRYEGKIVFNQDGFPLIEDADGTCHTDQVLRAIGAHWSEQVIAAPTIR
jgi:hypothetical protein